MNIIEIQAWDESDQDYNLIERRDLAANLLYAFTGSAPTLEAIISCDPERIAGIKPKLFLMYVVGSTPDKGVARMETVDETHEPQVMTLTWNDSEGYSAQVVIRNPSWGTVSRLGLAIRRMTLKIDKQTISGEELVNTFHFWE